MVELSQEFQCVHFIIQKYRNIFLYLKIESHDTGNGFLLTPTGSFFVGNALLHLIIILKPAYQGYFNRIKNAPSLLLLSKCVQMCSKGIKGGSFGLLGLWANGIKGGQRGSKGIKGVRTHTCDNFLDGKIKCLELVRKSKWPGGT